MKEGILTKEDQEELNKILLELAKSKSPFVMKEIMRSIPDGEKIPTGKYAKLSPEEKKRSLGIFKTDEGVGINTAMPYIYEAAGMNPLIGKEETVTEESLRDAGRGTIPVRNDRNIQPDASWFAKLVHNINVPLQGAAFAGVENILTDVGGKKAYERESTGKDFVPYDKLTEEQKSMWRGKYFEKERDRVSTLRSNRDENFYNKIIEKAERNLKGKLGYEKPIDLQLTSEFSTGGGDIVSSEDIGREEEWKQYKDSDEYNDLLSKEIDEILKNEFYTSSEHPKGKSGEYSVEKLDPTKAQTSARDILYRASAFADEPGVTGAVGKASRFITDTPYVRTILPAISDFFVDATLLIPPLKVGKKIASGLLKGAGAVDAAAQVAKPMMGITEAVENIVKPVSKNIMDAIEVGAEQGNTGAKFLKMITRDPTIPDQDIKGIIDRLPIPKKEEFTTIDTPYGKVRKPVGQIKNENGEMVFPDMYTKEEWESIKKANFDEMVKFRGEKQGIQRTALDEVKTVIKDTPIENMNMLPDEEQRKLAFILENYYDPNSYLKMIKEGKPLGGSEPNKLIQPLLNSLDEKTRMQIQEMRWKIDEVNDKALENKTISPEEMQANYLKRINKEHFMALNKGRENQGTLEEVMKFKEQKEKLKQLSGTMLSSEDAKKINAIKSIYGVEKKFANEIPISKQPGTAFEGITDTRPFQNVAEEFKPYRQDYDIAEVKIKDFVSNPGTIDEKINSVISTPKLTKQFKQDIVNGIKSSYDNSGRIIKNSFVDSIKELDMTMPEISKFVDRATSHIKVKSPKEYRIDAPIAMFQTLGSERGYILRKEFFDRISNTEGNGLIERIPKKTEKMSPENLAFIDDKIAKLKEQGLKKYEKGLELYKKTAGRESTKVGSAGNRMQYGEYDYYVKPEFIDAAENYERNFSGIMNKYIIPYTAALKPSLLALHPNFMKFPIGNFISGAAETSQLAKHPGQIYTASREAIKSLMGDSVNIKIADGKRISGEQLIKELTDGGGLESMSSEAYLNNDAAFRMMYGDATESGSTWIEKAKEKLNPQTNPLTQIVMAMNDKAEKMNRTTAAILYLKNNPGSTVKEAIENAVFKKHYNYQGMRAGARDYGQRSAVPFAVFTANAIKQHLTDWKAVQQMTAITRTIQGQNRTKESYGGTRGESYYAKQYTPTTLHGEGFNIDLGRYFSFNPIGSVLGMSTYGKNIFDVSKNIGASTMSVVNPLLKAPFQALGDVDFNKMSRDPYTAGTYFDEYQTTPFLGKELSGSQGALVKSFSEIIPYGQGLKGISDANPFGIFGDAEGMTGVNAFNAIAQKIGNYEGDKLPPGVSLGKMELVNFFFPKLRKEDNKYSIASQSYNAYNDFFEKANKKVKTRYSALSKGYKTEMEKQGAEKTIEYLRPDDLAPINYNNFKQIEEIARDVVDKATQELYILESSKKMLNNYLSLFQRILPDKNIKKIDETKRRIDKINTMIESVKSDVKQMLEQESFGKIHYAIRPKKETSGDEAVK